jgi:hypothetical protein
LPTAYLPDVRLNLTDLSNAILIHNLAVVRNYFIQNVGVLPPMPFVKEKVTYFVCIATEEGLSTKEIKELLHQSSIGVISYSGKQNSAIVMEWVFTYLTIMNFIFEAFYDLGIKDFYSEPLDTYIKLVMDDSSGQEQVWLDCFNVASGDIEPETLNSYEPMYYLYNSTMYTKDQPQCSCI